MEQIGFPDGMRYSPVMEKGQVVRIDVNTAPIELVVIAEGLNWPVAVKLDFQGCQYAEGDPDPQDRMFVSLLTRGTIAEVMADGAPRLLGPVGLVMPGGVVVNLSCAEIDRFAHSMERSSDVAHKMVQFD